MKKNLKLDLDILINSAIEIGNRLTGQKKPADQESLYYAEGLGQKIISHTISVRHLYHGQQLIVGNNQYPVQIDFASLAILVRAALETYLTLNHVFISAKTLEEAKFNFLCWHLAGFLDRMGFEPKNQAQIELKESERKSISALTTEIQASLPFSTLSKKQQEAVLRGNWRVDKSWRQLAVNAGFDEGFFKQQYSFLCGYAHSSRLSVIQIQQSRNLVQQQEMADASVGVAMVVLAKFMYDYIQLIPTLKAVQNNLSAFGMISIWKTIGEQLEK
ncbi:DUF5677 domain-containing protein [Hymenobacter ruricola]|uniref:Uncharacterized protein n=1 Tax=Hymenobacter ruricola TaxID=2791023 RepID=A0ABS0I8Y8_9BACT|nr:DUF5677 domain-containing protein [Hymenobacter ruricola]MBF9223384.1 hypothetical protein [Hymenobacter ruricola]